MTQAVAHILSEIEQLSESERREVRLAVTERIPMSGDLTDDDFGALAAESFRRLDEQEGAQSAWARGGLAGRLWRHPES